MSKLTAHFPSGAPKPRIAVVSDCAVVDDIERGLPLSGSSGRVFNSLLRTAGVERDNLFITNVFNETVQDNEIANICIASARAKEYEADQAEFLIPGKGFIAPVFRHHLATLEEDLRSFAPDVIIALGSEAFWATTGIPNVASYRGTPTPSTRPLGFKVIPTFHPKTVQKLWKYYPIVVADIVKAVSEAKRGREIIKPKRELLIEPTLDDIRSFFEECKQSDLLSVDIETGWGMIICIGFAPSEERAMCVPFVDMRKPNRSYWATAEEELEALGLVRELLAHPVPKLGQNFAGYDFLWLYKKYGLEPRNLLHDTRLMHHALYPELEKSLEFMGASYSKQGAWKHWGHSAMTKRDD